MVSAQDVELLDEVWFRSGAQTTLVGVVVRVAREGGGEISFDNAARSCFDPETSVTIPCDVLGTKGDGYSIGKARAPEEVCWWTVTTGLRGEGVGFKAPMLHRHGPFETKAEADDFARTKKGWPIVEVSERRGTLAQRRRDEP